MNKKTILFAAILFFTLSATAQLSGTAWKGLANIPDPYETVLQFKGDTLNLLLAEDQTLVEVMKYEIMGDTVKLTKLEGMSPCGDNSKGFYRFRVEGDKFYFVPLQDECDDRSAAFHSDPWIRQKM